MRVQLKPALRRIWRDATTLQLGVDPGHAVVVSGVGAAEARLLDLLDGTRDEAGVLRGAAAHGLTEPQARSFIGLLASGNALDDANAALAATRGLDTAEHDRLAPDLASLSLVHPQPGRGGSVLTARRSRTVRVRGASRVGASLAALLGAAGVGRLVLDDDRAMRPRDVAPGGVPCADTGRSRAVAAAAAVARVAPATTTSTPIDGEGAGPVDLVVLADGPATPRELASLARTGTPHLFAAVRETTAVIGPLVVPGAPCQRCCDLTRADRDPAWPWLAAQLSVPRRRGVEACDVSLAAVCSAHAALEVLTFLDRLACPELAAPATLGGTLELRLPDWRLRRRSWQPHPACGCRWAHD
jgi:hypothetical protein